MNVKHVMESRREASAVQDEAVHSRSLSEDLYRMLPSVHELLLSDRMNELLRLHSRSAVVNATRRVLERVREDISRSRVSATSLPGSIVALPSAVEDELRSSRCFSLRPVINATGVILHTNLGRAPLSKAALDHIVDVARGYSNLELDLKTGERSRRDDHVEPLILSLLAMRTGAAASAVEYRAIVVNNCAAAAFLALRSLAKGREVLVSRGELVEIGGGFRIPEILEESGALLKEVGTTNRTRIEDYENALSANSGLILRVHQSNFSMEGFVARPSLEELVVLGRRAQIPVFEDQGTGLVHSLQPYGIQGEATLIESFSKGCDLIAASGDKLLGGPQCGILIGRKELIEAIRRHPLFRAFRVDKLTYAALEATLAEYVADNAEAIPIVRMLELTPEQIRERCERIAGQVDAPGMTAEIAAVESVIGGGTAPKARLQSYAISLRHSDLDAGELLGALRDRDPAIIGRISDDLVLLDLRTVDAEYDSYLAQTLNGLLLMNPSAREEMGS